MGGGVSLWWKSTQYEPHNIFIIYHLPFSGFGPPLRIPNNTVHHPPQSIIIFNGFIHHIQNKSIEFVMVGVGSVRCCWESGVVARILKKVNCKWWIYHGAHNMGVSQFSFSSILLHFIAETPPWAWAISFMTHPMLHDPQITFFCSLFHGHFCILLLTAWLIWPPFSRLPNLHKITSHYSQVMPLSCLWGSQCLLSVIWPRGGY